MKRFSHADAAAAALFYAPTDLASVRTQATESNLHISRGPPANSRVLVPVHNAFADDELDECTRWGTVFPRCNHALTTVLGYF